MIQASIQKPDKYLTEVKSLSVLLKSESSCYYLYNHEQSLSFNRNYYDEEVKGIVSKKATVTIPQLFISKEFNVRIVGDYGLINDNGIINRACLPPWSTEDNKGNYNKVFLEKFYGITFKDDNIYADTKLDNCQVYEKECVFLATPTDDAFSHFIFETLAKLHVFGANSILDYDIVVSNHLKSYQKAILLSLGIKPENILPINKIKDGNYIFRSVIVVSWPSHNNMWTIPNALFYLRSTFYNTGCIRDKLEFLLCEQTKEVAYFDRNDERSQFRAILNEEELFSTLVNFNKEADKVTVGKFSFFEKYMFFNKFKTIVGQYGGGFQLCFNAPFGTNLIVIQSDLFDRQHIDFISFILGLNTINIVAKANRNELNANSPITVNLKDLNFVLKETGLKIS